MCFCYCEYFPYMSRPYTATVSFPDPDKLDTYKRFAVERNLDFSKLVRDALDAYLANNQTLEEAPPTMVDVIQNLTQRVVRIETELHLNPLPVKNVHSIFSKEY